MQEEWLNARGAIARFDRNTIEIRLLDVQECPAADMAICTAIVQVMEAMIEEAWCDADRQKIWETAPLAEVLSETTRYAEEAIIRNRVYPEAFGFPEGGMCKARDLWQHIIESLPPPEGGWGAVARILEQGTLGSRIIRALRGDYSHEKILTEYEKLCRCLEEGTLYE